MPDPRLLKDHMIRDTARAWAIIMITIELVIIKTKRTLLTSRARIMSRSRQVIIGNSSLKKEKGRGWRSMCHTIRWMKQWYRKIISRDPREAYTLKTSRLALNTRVDWLLVCLVRAKRLTDTSRLTQWFWVIDKGAKNISRITMTPSWPWRNKNYLHYTGGGRIKTKDRAKRAQKRQCDETMAHLRQNMLETDLFKARQPVG